MASSADDVFAACAARRIVPVTGLDDWKGGDGKPLVLFVRSLMENERSAYESSLFDTDGNIDDKKLKEARLQLISLSVCDESGRPIFTELQARRLASRDAGLVNLLYVQVRKHCGFDVKPKKYSAPEGANDDDLPTA